MFKGGGGGGGISRDFGESLEQTALVQTLT